MAMRFIGELFKSRCGSMSWYCCGYPVLLALLLSRDSAIVSEGMARFARRVAGYLAVWDIHLASVRQLVDRSVLQSPYM